jgi:hypothetical protein
MIKHDIGCPASESLKGVTRKEREQQGKKGGVVRIIYLTAVVPCLGESVGQTIKGGKAISIDIGEVCQTTILSPSSASALRFTLHPHIPLS